MDYLEPRLTITGVSGRRLDAGAKDIDQRLIRFVFSDVDGSHVFGDAHGETERSFAHAIPAIDWHDDAERAHLPHLQRLGRINLVRDALVVSMDAAEHDYEGRHDHNCNPRAFGKFRDNDDNKGNAGAHGTNGIDNE